MPSKLCRGEGEGERLRVWLTPPPLEAAPPALRRLMAKLPAALGSLDLGANASAAHAGVPPAAPLAQREVIVPEGVLPGQQMKLHVGGITVAAVVPPGLLAGHYHYPYPFP